MKKFFVTNLIFLLTLNILIKSFWILGIDRDVQNTLSSGDYGIYYALLNFTYLFNIILDLGITQFNNRTIAQNPILLRKYFAKILPLKLVLAGVYCAVLFGVAFIIGYDSFSFFLLKWLCVFQILTSLLTYLRSNVSALLLFKTDSFLSILDKSLTIIFCCLMLYTPILKNGFKVEYFVYVQVISMFVSVLTALIICLVKTKSLVKKETNDENTFITLSWDTKFMRAVLKFGFPYALLTLLMAFYNRMDTVMIERLLADGDVQSGIYASGFRLVDSVNMVAYLFSVILLPLFARMIKEKQDVSEIVKVSFQILLLITIGFAAVSVTYSMPLMELLYNKHIEESSRVYQVLSFCFIPVSMTYIFGTLLTANGSLKKLNIVALCGMIINIGVNLLLIPKFKAVGSAYSALTAQSITAILQIIIALKMFNIKVGKIYVLKILCFIASVIVSTILIEKLSIAWYIRLALSLMAYVLLSFVCRIFSVSEMKTYIGTLIDKKND